MIKGKPSWLCRACQDRFHVVCPDPELCILDNESSNDAVADLDDSEHRESSQQLGEIQIAHQSVSIQQKY
jgi:hypothetical protein